MPPPPPPPPSSSSRLLFLRLFVSAPALPSPLLDASLVFDTDLRFDVAYSRTILIHRSRSAEPPNAREYPPGAHLRKVSANAEKKGRHITFDKRVFENEPSRGVVERARATASLDNGIQLCCQLTCWYVRHTHHRPPSGLPSRSSHFTGFRSLTSPAESLPFLLSI